MAIDIKDRVAVGDNKYTMRTLSDGRVELTPSPDSVQEPGTPLNKALLQPIVDSVHNVLMNISDYVVEQGTSGVWTYRKWQSGIAECWAEVTHTVGSNYTEGNPVQIKENYPFTFTDTPKVFVQFTEHATTFGTVTNGWRDKSELRAIAMPSEALALAGFTFTIFCDVKGRWK